MEIEGVQSSKVAKMSRNPRIINSVYAPSHSVLFLSDINKHPKMYAFSFSDSLLKNVAVLSETLIDKLCIVCKLSSVCRETRMEEKRKRENSRSTC